jgi:hypothetical protein
MPVFIGKLLAFSSWLLAYVKANDSDCHGKRLATLQNK